MEADLRALLNDIDRKVTIITEQLAHVVDKGNEHDAEIASLERQLSEAKSNLAAEIARREALSALMGKTEGRVDKMVWGVVGAMGTALLTATGAFISQLQ